MGKKIGILGGTFNPIHFGHIKLAQVSYEQLLLDKVIFMPSGQSYMKRDMYVVPGEERLKLIDLAIANVSYFESSDIELKRQGNTYTYETLQYLHSQHPEDVFYFILGADCLFSMEKWLHPELIFSQCIIVAAVRNGMDKENLKKQAIKLQNIFQAKIELLDFEELKISSTEIRNKLEKGESVSDFVPSTVEEYIFAHKLFIK